MVRLLITISLALALGCRTTIAPGVGTSPATVGPGAAWLAPLSMQPEVRRWRVTIHRANDTTDRPYSTRTVTRGPNASAPGTVQIVSVWPPPTTSVDTFVVIPNGLRPIGEVLRYNGYTRHFQYSGGHVWGSVQHADSAARPYDHTFAGDPAIVSTYIVIAASREILSVDAEQRRTGTVIRYRDDTPRTW